MKHKINNINDRIVLHRNPAFIKEEYGLPKKMDVTRKELKKNRDPKELVEFC